MAGGNGRGGVIFARNADNMPTIRLEGETGNVFIGGASGVDGDLDDNSEDRFPHSTDVPDAHYRYRMTTGEELVLDFRFPAHVGIGIHEIRLPDGTTLKSDDTLIYEDPFSFPLIEVMEVDERFRFTGRTFAQSSGDGVVRITNHFANFGLTLDSSNYRNPQRSGTLLT